MRYFTPQEASRTLPLVRKIVKDILEIGQDFYALQMTEPTEVEKEKMDRMRAALHDLFAELEELGCFFKDVTFTQGMVDFPAIIDGEEVYLCWKTDEPDLLYYHGINAGFAGRKPIPASYLQQTGKQSPQT